MSFCESGTVNEIMGSVGTVAPTEAGHALVPGFRWCINYRIWEFREMAGGSALVCVFRKFLFFLIFNISAVALHPLFF